MIKKISLIALLIFVNAVALAQDVNKNDAAGKRHGLWKGTYEKSKKPRYEGTFDHGKETGTFKFFEEDEKSTLKATRVFDKDGSCYTTFFDPKGNKVSEGREVNRLPEGEWKYYKHNSKALMSTERYIDGKLTGTRKVFYDKGAVAEEANYVNGIKEGPYKKYTEKGVVLEEVIYKNDNCHGTAIYRDADNNIVSQGQYKNGLKVGIWKFYEKGKPVKETNMDISARKAAGRKKVAN